MQKLYCGSPSAASSKFLSGIHHIRAAPPEIESESEIKHENLSVSVNKNFSFADKCMKGGIFLQVLANSKLQLTVTIYAK